MHKLAVRVIPALGMMWVAAAHAQVTQPMSTTLNLGQGPAGNYLPIEQSGAVGNYTPRTGPRTIDIPVANPPTCLNNCNSYIGIGAGASYANGDFGTVGIGYWSLHNLLGGPKGSGLESEVTALGFTSGATLTTGVHDIIIGTHALAYATSASWDIAIGADAMAFSNVGTGNNPDFAIGDSVLSHDQGSGNNVVISANAMKMSAGQDPSSGQFTVVGQNSFQATAGLTTANQIVAIGDGIAKIAVTTAHNDVIVGSGAGAAITTDSYSTFLGDNSGSHAVGGSYNTFVGANKGCAVTSGAHNTLVGADGIGGSCQTITTGSNNIMIGSNLSSVGATNNGQVDIGDLVFYNINSTAAPTTFTGCGSSPSIDANANNKSGTFTMGTGGVTSCAITFAGAGYRSWNHCRVTPHSVSTAFGYSYTTTVLTVTGTNISSVVIDYDCDGQ